MMIPRAEVVLREVALRRTSRKDAPPPTPPSETQEGSKVWQSLRRLQQMRTTSHTVMRTLLFQRQQVRLWKHHPQQSSRLPLRWARLRIDRGSGGKGRRVQ